MIEHAPSPQAASAASAPWGIDRRGRALVVLRWFHLAATLMVLVIVGAITLSDRVVPALSGAFTETTSAASSAVADRTGESVPSADTPIGWDTLTHVVLWTAVAVPAAGLARRFRHGPMLWLGLIAVSAVFEVAQQELTEKRRLQLIDIAANGLGVTLGLIGGSMILAVEFGVLAMVRWTVDRWTRRRSALAA